MIEVEKIMFKNWDTFIIHIDFEISICSRSLGSRDTTRRDRTGTEYTVSSSV